MATNIAKNLKQCPHAKSVKVSVGAGSQNEHLISIEEDICTVSSTSESIATVVEGMNMTKVCVVIFEIIKIRCIRPY